MPEDTKRLFTLFGELLYRGATIDWHVVRALTDGAGETEVEALRESADELRRRLSEADFVGFDERVAGYLQEHGVTVAKWPGHVQEIQSRLDDIVLETLGGILLRKETVTGLRVAIAKMRFTCEDLSASCEVKALLLQALDDDLSDLERGSIGIFASTKQCGQIQLRESTLVHLSQTQSYDPNPGSIWHMAVRSGERIPKEIIPEILDAIGEVIDEGELTDAGDDAQDAAPGQSTPTPALAVGDDDGQDAASSDGISWRDVAERLKRLHASGDKYTNRRDFAARFSCRLPVIQRAIEKRPSLHVWAKFKTGSAPKAESLSEVVTDSTPQSREPDPAGEMTDDDAQVTMRRLIEESPPEKRAELHKALSRLPPDELQRVLAAYVGADDLGNRVLGRRP